jgi:hypothetical protein
MTAAVCLAAAAVAAALAPAALVLPVPEGLPRAALGAGLVFFAGVLAGASRLLWRERRTLVVAREGIFVATAAEVRGARWEEIVDVRVKAVGPRPHLLVQRGGAPHDAGNLEQIPLSGLDASPEDVDALVRAASRDESRRPSLPSAAEAGIDLARYKARPST